jgi:hypothetical protein
VHLRFGEALELTRNYALPPLWLTGLGGAAETTASAFRQRLNDVWQRVRHHPWSAQVLEGIVWLDGELAALAPDTRVIADFEELAAMAGANEWNEMLGRAVNQATHVQSPRDAVALMGLMGLTGELERDSVSARRRMGGIAGAARAREAFFVLALGWPSNHEPATARLKEWIAQAPEGPQLKPIEDEARALMREVVARGVVVLSEEAMRKPVNVRFFALPARERSAAALGEILQQLVVTGVAATTPKSPITGDAPITRVVWNPQLDRLPVFDPAVLSECIATLGDGLA